VPSPLSEALAEVLAAGRKAARRGLIPAPELDELADDSGPATPNTAPAPKNGS
jgi:hypothetical protein